MTGNGASRFSPTIRYDIKAIVYEMRFDEVTHTYGEFGPFYNGLPLPMREIYKRVLLV